MKKAENGAENALPIQFGNHYSSCPKRHTARSALLGSTLAIILSCGTAARKIRNRSI